MTESNKYLAGACIFLMIGVGLSLGSLMAKSDRAHLGEMEQACKVDGACIGALKCQLRHNAWSAPDWVCLP